MRARGGVAVCQIRIGTSEARGLRVVRYRGGRKAGTRRAFVGHNPKVARSSIFADFSQTDNGNSIIRTYLGSRKLSSCPTEAIHNTT